MTAENNESYETLLLNLQSNLGISTSLLAEDVTGIVSMQNGSPLTWIACCKTLCDTAFHRRFGAQIATRLSLVAPRQGASWLECLKKLAMVIQIVKSHHQKLHRASKHHRASEELVQEKTAEISSAQEETYGKLLVATLNCMWPELTGTGGLTSKHWRTRLAAVELASVLFENGTMDGHDDALFQLHGELLEQLIFTLALSDSHWSVRMVALQCASKVFDGIQKYLPVAESDRYIWGFLATSVDKQIEVQNAAADIFLQEDTVLKSQCCKEIVVRLVHKFVTSAIFSLRSLQKTSKTTMFEGFKYPPDMRVLLPAIEGVVHLQLLGTSASMPEDFKSGGSSTLVPLLVAASAALLEECEISRNRSGAKEVSQLLRSLGLSQCRHYVISMVSCKYYEGASLAKSYESSCFIDDDLASLLDKLETVVILKGVSIALEGFGGQNGPLASQQRVIKDPELGKLEAHALRHIVEVVEIPPDLVNATNETRDGHQAEKFVHNSYYFLRIADAILKGTIVDMNKGDLLQGLVLSCASMASAEEDAETPLSWITKDIQELANGIVKHLGTSFSDVGALEAQEAGETPKLKIEASIGVERLMLRILPNLIPKFKSQLRDHLSKDHEGNFEASSSVSLASAIIAAHQMYWCLKQVKHPHLGPSCTLLMPCALMALDHYSPYIKRQAMKLFIHFTENLNPSELRWYKDAVLECATRSIVGCGELWPLVVQMTVRLVICMEGNNPRARWYRSILNEMLGELERHQSDATRFTVWLQHISKLLEAMGLLLVAHFKRLLPLLFLWLHAPDDSITLLVLNSCCIIIKHTWPRMPFHVERFWQELAQAYKESSGRTLGPAIRSSVIEVCELLKLCGGPAFEAAWQKDELDSSVAPLKSALAHHLDRLQTT